MRVCDTHGTIPGFEVSNWLLGRADVCIIVRRAGWRIRAYSPWPIGTPTVFCEFDVDGERFVVEKAWSGSDCYWIGATTAGPSRNIASVREWFQATEPPVWPGIVRALGLGLLLGGGVVLGISGLVQESRWAASSLAAMAAGAALYSALTRQLRGASA